MQQEISDKEEIHLLKRRVYLLEKENEELKERLAQVERAIDSKLSIIDNGVDNSLSKKEKNPYGFTLARRKTGGKEEYWYAGTRIDGKLRWIYVGKEKSAAREKIRAYLEKNYPGVLQGLD